MDANMSKGPSDTKKHGKQKKKECPPPSREELEAKIEGIAPPESPMNMDTFNDGANTTCLEEENLKLKEQRLCKVNIGQIIVTKVLDGQRYPCLA